ncbi:MAG: hypothetical protein ACREX4_22000 [Gammaproteobacteria bacterium]
MDAIQEKGALPALSREEQRWLLELARAAIAAALAQGLVAEEVEELN